MVKESIYKELPLLKFEANKLSKEGGDIKGAAFETPKLQIYSVKIPARKKVTVQASTKHSKRDDLIYCGLSSKYYFGIMHKRMKNEKVNFEDICDSRFEIIIEYQSIISLASVLETFVKGIIHKQKGFKQVIHDFNRISIALKKEKIDLEDLDAFKDPVVYERMKEIINYLFRVRNLIVHNGGVVDNKFHKFYKEEIVDDVIGKVIRINHSQQAVIRDWMSFLIQEICKVIPNYDKIWKDYLQSTGIFLLKMHAHPIYRTGKIGPEIQLEEGKSFKDD